MKKFTKYPVKASEGQQFGIVMYVSGEKRGYLYRSTQSRGHYTLRVSTDISDAKTYPSLTSAKRAYANYKFATEIFVYDNSGLLERWYMYLRDGYERDDLKKWDSRVEFKIEPLEQAVTGSYTIDSIEQARERKIPQHIIMAMHSDILSLLEKEYPDRDFELLVQPNNDEYRPAIDIVIESWIDYADTQLIYKVYLDDPTVIYYGEDYTDESEFGVDSDLSEKIRAIVEKYLRYE